MQQMIDPAAGRWRKSSHSMVNGDCVEVALFADGHVGLRDSKNPSGGVIVLSAGDYAGFLEAIKQGNV
ncbi:DUF397 domain-containing protein [Nonomuraea sp. NPDC050783]|uniref:DUF397 domain-containing protein n=1 Tax=Nonomuraea sp. NPDC050783 TaxID=3154634 RepID=UPI003465449A